MVTSFWSLAGKQGVFAVPFNVSVTDPEMISAIEGVYTGCRMLVLVKVPVPVVVQRSELNDDAVASRVVTIVPSHIFASAPALTTGDAVICRMRLSDRETVQGAIGEAFITSVTLPVAISAALGL